MKKKVIVSVINDLVSDRRVDRVCNTLNEMGFEVKLLGRKYHNSPAIGKRAYKTHRMHLIFRKGPFFYAEYNIRLLLKLLMHKADLLVSNDLDTLLPNYLVHKFKGTPLVYDTHEYFTGVPELAVRKRVRKIWKAIERRIFPKLQHVITVNESIAKLYHEEYGNDILVVRNIPDTVKTQPQTTKSELGLPTEKRIILLQGAGINVDRGAEEAIDAMQYIDNSVLVILGDGDVVVELKLKVNRMGLDRKVKFIPRQAPEMLFEYTTKADIGLTLDKDTNINYRYSLPNKLFDYIHAGVPVLATPLVEIKQIIEKYDVGCLIDNHEPNHIADKMKMMLENSEDRKRWKANLKLAATELTWENEKKVLTDLYSKYA
ncbi:MAG: glycosyltransferase [Bacteroidales bacterium]|nr:glycosyltransferase [Bacteroidales bacterium]